MATRRVSQNGLIRWKDQRLFLSQSLTGWDVGLKSTENGPIEVWFAQLLLGHINQSVTDVLNLKCYLCPDLTWAIS